MATLDVAFARSHFPILHTSNGYIFADNAGGSQCTKDVADRVHDYLINTNVQLGADYHYSVLSTNRASVDGPEAAKRMFNAGSADEIVFGMSSTLNLENLAGALEDDIQEGEEIIITQEHEANCGPWKRLAARRKCVLKYWKSTPTNPANPYSLALKVNDLLDLITKKTRIIAFTACSNILGSIVPVEEAIKAARAKAAEVGVRRVEFSVDCVAYAPHRMMDVQKWDVDFCVFSYYKVYGPHVSAMYVRKASLKTSISPLCHHFLLTKHAETSYKIQGPGGPGYETVYGTTGVLPYLLSLSPNNTLSSSFDAIVQHEQTLLSPLLSYLTDQVQHDKGVRIVGEESSGLGRAPTVSFIVLGRKSSDIVRAFDQTGKMGIRFGHFYAYTLLSELEPKVDPEDGVVRVSLVHYNTVEEVQRLVEVFKTVL